MTTTPPYRPRHRRLARRPAAARPGRGARGGGAGAVLAALLLAAGAGCSNSPYPREDEGKNYLYSTFYDEPSHMDPGQTYSAFAYTILGNVLEPPFTYHYLKHPYELIPLTAREVPRRQRRKVVFGGRSWDAVVYTIRIRPGIFYHDHPCFVEAHRRLTDADLAGVRDALDLRPLGTRELVAADFVYAIRRLADERTRCPLYPTFAKNLLGLEEYHEMLSAKLQAARAARRKAAGVLYNREQDEKYNPIRLDYAEDAERFPFVRLLDRYRFEVVLQHPYPQILNWMALPFFAPVPPEAIEFYSQGPVLRRSWQFDKTLIGTGPFRLREYDPTNQIVLERNPRFREMHYPDLPAPDPNDAAAVAHWRKMKDAGLLEDVGNRLPQIDRIILRMEKESIPRWNKFLQGYYDSSGIQSDLFDQAVRLSSQGESELTDDLRRLGIRLVSAPAASFYFYNFNMEDPVVGGLTEPKRKLRQAISIAFSSEDKIAIFDNGRGVVSHGPIPPGIFGYEMSPEGINSVVYRWDPNTNRPVRRSLEEAKRLLAEAGYPGGFGPDGQLTIRFVTSWAAAEGRARVRFVVRQLEKLNIRVKVETEDGNRFLDKVESGSFQLVAWGWNADYPDPENFLFLFYAPDPNGDQPADRNVARYYNPEYNRLFNRMKAMENGPERLAVIRQALAVLRNDAPAIFLSHPVRYDLYHHWYHSVWPNAMALNSMMYHRIDPVARAAYRREHNTPRLGPVVGFFAALVLLAVPAGWLAARRLREA